MSCHHFKCIYSPTICNMHNWIHLFCEAYDTQYHIVFHYWQRIDRWSHGAARRVSPDGGTGTTHTLSAPFHSPIFLLSLSSNPRIQVPLYNLCPGAAAAFSGTGFERQKRQMFNFHFLCASLSIPVCVFVDHFGTFFLPVKQILVFQQFSVSSN